MFPLEPVTWKVWLSLLILVTDSAIRISHDTALTHLEKVNCFKLGFRGKICNLKFVLPFISNNSTMVLFKMESILLHRK